MVAETAARAGDTALATALTEESVALAMRLDSLGQLAQLPVLAVAARAMPSSTSLSVHARSLT
jgi:hypothetical protein